MPITPEEIAADIADDLTPDEREKTVDEMFDEAFAAFDASPLGKRAKLQREMKRLSVPGVYVYLDPEQAAHDR